MVSKAVIITVIASAVALILGLSIGLTSDNSEPLTTSPDTTIPETTVFETTTAHRSESSETEVTIEPVVSNVYVGDCLPECALGLACFSDPAQICLDRY